MKIAKQKNLPVLYLKYLLPTLATMTLFSSYTMVDGIFVGQGLGYKGLSAVNLSMPFVTLGFALAILLSVGSSNLISYYLGRSERDKADEFFSLALVLGLFLGLTLALVSFLFTDELVVLLGAEGEIVGLLKEYILVIMIFIPFYVMTYIFEILIKADGFPHLSTILMLASALTNIVLDYLFIFRFHLGVRGAAIATGIAQVLPTVGYSLHFLSKKANLRFCKFHFSFAKLKRILSFGFPASLAELSTGFIILLFNNKIGDLYGLSGIASFSVIAYILTFVVNTMLAINQASQPLMSFYYGAREYKSLLKTRRYMLYAVALLSTGLCVCIQVRPEFFVNVFISDYSQDFLASSVRALRRFSLSFLIVGYNICLGGYLTAVHRPKFDFCINILRGYLLISLSVFLLPVLFSSSAIWYGLLVSEAVCFLCSLTFLKSTQRQALKQDRGVRLPAG